MPLTDDPWLFYDSDGNVPAVRAAALVAVYRYDGSSSLFELPNVECLGIVKREGTDPGSASFRYNLASGLDGAPVSMETALGTDFSGTYVVNAGDRLVVQAARPDGVAECLFDGIAIDFGMGLDPEMEEVMIGAVGIAFHAWDDVIPGALMRGAGSPQTIDDVKTDVPAQFNPGGLPNCVLDGYMAGSLSGGNDYRYPTFFDAAVVGNPDRRTKWTLPKACRYILFNANASQQYINNPDGRDLDSLLVSPNEGANPFSPINCPDTPITGRDWPTTVNQLVSEYGFGTAFDLATDDSGLPVTSFRIFGLTKGDIKSLYLAARGTSFDPTLFNVSGAGLRRDLSDVVNQWTVKGALSRYEASFVLAPGSPMNSTDSSDANIPGFGTDNDLFKTTNQDLYRLYIFDEACEGRYAVGTNSRVTDITPVSLDKLFGKYAYVRRRRKPIGTLISVGPNNRPYEARLSISTDYEGTSPGLWDGSGTWQPITSTTWTLLQDRIGIYITDQNPEKWEIGMPKASGMPFPDGRVRGVTNQAEVNPGTNFFLRLTCVVEADHALTRIATPKGNSPLSQVINRVTDASDRYRNDRVGYPSEFNSTGGNVLNPRNDNDIAMAEAISGRAASEAGVLEGPVTIPRLTTYYKIGDRVDQVEGRNLGLRTDQGTGDPIYPVVVGVSWQFGPETQTTTIEVSDAGTRRADYKRPPARKPRSNSDILNDQAARASAILRARASNEAMARAQAKALQSAFGGKRRP